jgi:hypothetical protein
LDSIWIASEEDRIVIVVDLLRSKYGAFPPSTLSMTINGSEVASSTQALIGDGQFLLLNEQFGPISVRPGDRVGYSPLSG